MAPQHHTVHIIRNDGSAVLFDSDDLQTTIIRACIAAGETDSWIAGDLALSVEFALTASDRKTLRQGELNDLVSRALEDSGYPAVAAEFKKTTGAANPDYIPLTEISVSETLKQNIALPEEPMKQLVRKVYSALASIGFSKVTPRLVLEMGRQFRDMEPENMPKELLKAPAHKFKAGEGILLRQTEFPAAVPPDLQQLLNAGILKIRNVSRIFPAIRVQLYLSGFAEFAHLDKPVTELSFCYVAPALAEKLNGIYALAGKICMERDASIKEIPSYLTIVDTAAFALNYMNCPKNYAKEYVASLLNPVTQSLQKPLFKLTLS